MPLIALVLLLALFAAIYAPAFWVRHKLRAHGAARPDLPGTGGELAAHLLERAGLEGVTVEQSKEGMDHYDPQKRVVRLSPGHYGGRSISAVAVAAHEVGHALQHARGEKLFFARIALIKAFAPLSKMAGILLLIGPFVSVLIRMPGLSVVFLALAVLVLAFELVVHVLTLPVEFDASFGKALPILSGGGYLEGRDLAAARGVLRAASLTYVAGALAGVFNIFRLLRILR